MELKWLEDFLTVAATRHFARAADERNITQSALSRRIKSLEYWLGTELFDRSSHPISLTRAGTDFIQFAREILSQSELARATLAESSSMQDRDVTIACLHTLALYFVPEFYTGLQSRIGEFGVSIISETRTVDEYLSGLTNGNCDFFISYRHPSVPLSIDTQQYPLLDLGIEKMVACHADGHFLKQIQDGTSIPLPYLAYSGSSFLSNVVQNILKSTPWASRLNTVYRASLAESLTSATEQGIGMAWLPESLAKTKNGQTLTILEGCPTAEMNISIYRSTGNMRPVVNQIWDALQQQYS